MGLSLSVGQWCQPRLLMSLRPRKSVENRIPLRHIVDSPATPRPTTQQTKHGEQPAAKCTIPFERLDGIVRTAGVVLATRRCVRGNGALIPAHSRNQHRPERSHDVTPSFAPQWRTPWRSARPTTNTTLQPRSASRATRYRSVRAGEPHGFWPAPGSGASRYCV